MKGMSRTISTLALALMALSAVPSANAALRAVGPISAVHGLPVWYQDIGGLTLRPCLDQTLSLTGAGPLCVLPPEFDPVVTPPPALRTVTQVAPINATNFPAEVFYWIADVAADPLVTGGVGGGATKLRLRMALEASALAPALTFMRINIQQMDGLVALGSYTVSTPYGDISFTADALGTVKDAAFNGQTFRNQIDALPPLFDAILPAIFPLVAGHQAAAITMDQLLVWNPAVAPAAPVGFIGDPNILHSVVKTGDTVPAVVTFSGTGLPLQTITQFAIAGQTFGMDVQPGTTFNFGTNNIGTTVPAPQTVTVINRTGSPFTFADLNLPATKKGVDAADFIAAPSATVGAAPFCFGAVAVGASCSFDIVFTPKASAIGVAEHAARAATITLAPNATPPVPPVVLNLSGTAQVTVNATTPAGQHGTVTPATQTVGAGAPVTLALTPTNKKFKVQMVSNSVGLNGAVNVPAPFTFNAGGGTNAVTATFMPSGDLDMDGAVTVNDALRALRLVVGVPVVPVKALDDDAAMILAPLAAGVPAPVTTRTVPSLGDVLVILRRAVNLETW